MRDIERISSKMAKFKPSLTLALKSMVEQRTAQGLEVYDFGLGETKGKLDPLIQEAGSKAFQEGRTMYTDPAGLPELRRAVLKWLGLEREYGIESVVVSTGAKQSLFNIILAICNPADAILLDAAPWVSYEPIAVAAYAFPVMVLPLGTERTHLKVTPKDLVRNLNARPHAKLFLLNNPVNPTAQLYSKAELDALLDVCIERRIYFVLDRLYWKIMFDGHEFPTPRLHEEAKRWVIQVDGMSKNFRRTGGLRIGWAVGPDDVVKAIINLQSHYTSGPATPTQAAALAAISKPYRGGLITELQRKRDLLHEVTKDLPLVRIWPTPATFYSFWDVRETFGRTTPDGREIRNSDDLAAYLVGHAGVVTASGSGFMQDGYLRLSFAVDDWVVRNGMAAVRRALSELS